MTYPAEFIEFVRLFNEGEYYDAHEVLEDLWVIEVPPTKDYYKGLIQAAAALLLWERGKCGGSKRLYDLALLNLDKYPDFFHGTELEEFRSDFRGAFVPMFQHDVRKIDHETAMQVQLNFNPREPFIQDWVAEGTQRVS